MTDNTVRTRKSPVRLGHAGEPFEVGELVRARVGQTVAYWPATLMSIDATGMTVRWTGECGAGAVVTVPADSIRRPGADFPSFPRFVSWSLNQNFKFCEVRYNITS